MEDNNYNSNTFGISEVVTLPEFKEIRKSTVSETYKYFNKLFQGKTITNLDERISLSTELSLFDESLQLMLIDTLHLKEEVLKILLSQNDVRIKRILHCKWFFQDLPSELCINEIFPFVSLSVRCKIINKLSRSLLNTEEAEKYFVFIRAKYDNERANFILPRCSEKFILDYIEETKSTFNYDGGLRVLFNICQRYPEVGIKILSTIFGQKGEVYNNLSKYRKIMSYLSGYYPELMKPLLNEYISVIPSSTFGRRLTKKLGPKFTECFFPKLIKNMIFKDEVFFSLLSIEGKAKYITDLVQINCESLSVNSWCGLNYTLCLFLKLVPQDKRLTIIQSALKQVYNLDFNDHAEFWCRELLELLPTKTRMPYVEKIEKLVEGDVAEFKKTLGSSCLFTQQSEYFIYLYDSSLAFEKLKEILWKTPNYSRRENILIYLVKSCKINNDLKTLEKAVDYVTTRHRNDDVSVIFRFIEIIYEEFPISALNLTIFEKLDDLAYFANLKVRGYEYINNNLKEKHIFYRLGKNMDVSSQVKSYFESSLLKESWVNLVQDYKSKHAKFFILALSKEIVNWLENKPSGDSETSTELLRVLDACKIYNRLNRNNKISLREIPGLEKMLQKIVKENYGEVGGEDWTIDVWEKYYGAVKDSYEKPKCLLYVLKRKPSLVEKYLEGILKILFSHYYRAHNSFVIFLKRTASFFGFTEKLKEIILNEFKNGETTQKRKTALELYSHLCTIDEFTKAVEKYIPKQERVERGSDTSFDEIQILVPSLIKRIRPGWKNLDLVLKFFFGDFLKSVLPSFNSCLCRTRCDVALTFLKKRLEEIPPKVSYIKDIIRLILDLSDRKDRAEFCLFCWDHYKHYSVRTVVLGYVTRFFLDMPTPDSFQILRKCILDSDETTIEVLPEMYNIPKEYFDVYVKSLWEFSENQKPNFRSNFRNKLLNRVNENNIGFISTEFSEFIIKKNLFDPTAENPVDEFAVLYVAAKPEMEEGRIRMILDLVNDVKPVSGSVHNFLNSLLRESRKKPADFADLFMFLLENWPRYPPGVLYEDKLLFTYTNLHQKLVKKFGDTDVVPVEVGKELKKLFSRVDNLNDYLYIYASVLKNFFDNLGTLKAIVAVKELVAGFLDRTLAILIILSLPQEAVIWYNSKEKFNSKDVSKGKKDLEEIVKVLEGFGDDVVKIYLRVKLEVELPTCDL